MELEKQAESPQIARPCKTCIHRKNNRCEDALIKGFEKDVWTWDFMLSVPGWRVSDAMRHPAKLCGPEKALWQPIPVKLTFWQRIKSCLNNL